MTCPTCGTENLPGRKFCGQCGSALALVCGTCGTSNPPDVLFCGECGSRLAAEAEPVETSSGAAAGGAERRLVSVLFTDLVGFTTLAEHRDPEEVRELLTRYFDGSRAVIDRYGGTVEKFIGDAVMAVWGAPVAHEDDAERAVRAALDLVDSVDAFGKEIGGVDLRLRAAVSTGEAAVTLGAEGQGMVAGDLVNTTSRLQSIAEPGTVLVDEGAYLAAGRSVAFESAGMHSVKGKDTPVKAWRALRVVAGRRGARWTDVLEPPFVGREEEFRLVKDLFQATARERKPRLVSIMGVAGIGKSRLAWEFYKYIDGIAERVSWHQGRSPAYGEGLTFWALGEMVRMRAGIAEGEEPAESRTKLERIVDEFVAEEDRAWVLDALAHLLGLEESTGKEREELFAAWRTFFERIADRGPVVLFFEDLQWADPGLIDFIEHVLEWSRTLPILVIASARPELMDRRPTWGAGQRNFTSVHLERLSDDAMRELLSGMAGGLSEDLVGRIVERAEGIPLYAVETVRMLLDRGQLVAEDGSLRSAEVIEELQVPDSLHGLIAARLDGLAVEDRSLVQDASVLGKSFTVQALSGLSGLSRETLEPRLRELIRKEVLVLDADPRSPERGQYAFVQSLLREVAYQTLSKRDRRTKHLEAAHYLESLEDDELASAVATHYMEAYRATAPGSDAEALAARALDSLVQAADRAGGLGSYAQSLAYLEQALMIVPDPDRRAELWETAGSTASKSGDPGTAERYLRQALEWHRERAEASAAARVATTLGGVLLINAREAEAIKVLQDAAAELFDLEGDPAGLDLAAELARAYMMNREAGPSLEWCERALASAEAVGLVPLIVDVLVTKGTVLGGVGRVREGIALMTGALQLAEQQSLVRPRLRALNNLSGQLLLVDPPASLRLAQQQLELASRWGLRNWELKAAELIADFALHLGDWELSARMFTEIFASRVTLSPFTVMAQIESDLYRGQIEAATDGLRTLRSELGDGSAPSTAFLPFVGAQIALVSGDLDRAYEQAMEAAARLEDDPGLVAWSWWLGAWAALWSSDVGRAKTALEAMAVGERFDVIEAAAMEVAAGVAALEGRREEALEGYRRALASLRKLSAPFFLAQVELDFVLVMGAEEPEARAAGEEARQIFSRLGAKPFLERLESVLGGPVTEPVSLSETSRLG